MQKLFFRFADDVAAEIFSENLRNDYAPVSLLILLDERRKDAACSEPGAVEGVNVLDLAGIRADSSGSLAGTAGIPRDKHCQHTP